jgi:uncharacterized membrane protein YeaQ/YmgE (transglycosylase-associated protein family)
MKMDAQALLITIIIGLVAGFLASVVVGGSGGLVKFLVSGLIGSFVGPLVLNALGVNLGIRSPLVSQIAVSTIGAIVVLILANLIR